METNDNFVTSDKKDGSKLTSPPTIPKKRKHNFLDFQPSADSPNQNDGEELLIKDNEIEDKYISGEDQVLSIPRLYGLNLDKGANQTAEIMDTSTTERVTVGEASYNGIKHIVVTPDRLVLRSSNLFCRTIDPENSNTRQGRRGSMFKDLSHSLPAEMCQGQKLQFIETEMGVSKKSKSYTSSLSKATGSPIIFHGTCARYSQFHLIASKS